MAVDGEHGKKMLEVVIAGKTYRLASHYNDAYLSEITSYLNQRITEVEARVKNRSAQQLLLLVALDIADDHLRMKKRHEKHTSEIGEEIEALITSVDEKIERYKAFFG